MCSFHHRGRRTSCSRRTPGVLKQPQILTGTGLNVPVWQRFVKSTKANQKTPGNRDYFQNKSIQLHVLPELDSVTLGLNLEKKKP